MVKRKEAGSSLPDVTEASNDAYHGSAFVSKRANGVKDPGANDVLCGRGDTINRHPGNEYFRNLVESQRRIYLTCQFKREKRLIAENIVDQIHARSPPGKFLTKDPKTGLWTEVDEEKARVKCSQALREGAKVIRAELSADTGNADENAYVSHPKELQDNVPRNTTARQECPPTPWENHGSLYPVGYPVPHTGMIAVAHPPTYPPMQDPSLVGPPHYMFHGCVVLHPLLPAPHGAVHGNPQPVQPEAWTNYPSNENYRTPFSSLLPDQTAPPPTAAAAATTRHQEAYQTSSPKRKALRSKSMFASRDQSPRLFEYRTERPLIHSRSQATLGHEYENGTRIGVATAEQNFARQRPQGEKYTTVLQQSPLSQRGVFAAGNGASLTPRSPFYDELQGMYFSDSPMTTSMSFSLSPDHPPAANGIQAPTWPQQPEVPYLPSQEVHPFLRQQQRQQQQFGAVSYSPLIRRASVTASHPKDSTSSPFPSQFPHSAEENTSSNSGDSASPSSYPNNVSPREISRECAIDSPGFSGHQPVSTSTSPAILTRAAGTSGGASLMPDTSLALPPPPPLPRFRLSMRPSRHFGDNLAAPGDNGHPGSPPHDGEVRADRRNYALEDRTTSSTGN